MRGVLDTRTRTIGFQSLALVSPAPPSSSVPLAPEGEHELGGVVDVGEVTEVHALGLVLEVLVGDLDLTELDPLEVVLVLEGGDARVSLIREKVFNPAVEVVHGLISLVLLLRHGLVEGLYLKGVVTHVDGENLLGGVVDEGGGLSISPPSERDMLDVRIEAAPPALGEVDLPIGLGVLRDVALHPVGVGGVDVELVVLDDVLHGLISPLSVAPL